ncbi:vacuolar amino acid transporter 1-like isoform X1 [Carex littledalei]|uniref:Vacuolar amino acid transporter 1-like isoform X1 n=1 Tax=Carex littledalei TaxID=544730 RepID=A0A833QDY3_9POAL|nr:vacuolar amino acid transporter 1-like isoform X1 [Carex littledalei]
MPNSPQKSGSTFFRTCFNGVNALSGVGILSIPYALAQGGWLSMSLLLLLAVICYYTGLLLQKCMDSNSLVKTYPDIGELAFGQKGRIIVATAMYLELYFAAINFLILEGDNLEKLFPKVAFNISGLKIGGKQGFVVITSLIVLPTTWLRSLSMLAYMSVGGVLASMILMVSVLWAAVFNGIGFRQKGIFLNWEGIPTAVSLYAFCFSGHSVFPTIYNSMQNPSKFSKVLLYCFALCTLNYALMAVVGYLMYGQDIKSQITLNLPNGKWSTNIAIYTTLMNPLMKYALIVMPISNAIEEWFQFSKSRLFSILIRTILVISTTVVALIVPFFAEVVGLTGALLSSTATMVLPCLCYLKITKTYQKLGFELIVCVVIALIGVLIAIFGTYSSLRSIAKNL